MESGKNLLGSHQQALAGGLLAAAGVIALVFALADLRAAADNPDAQEHHFSLFNDTGVAASTLQIVFNGPVKKPIVQEEVGGCPDPMASVEGDTVITEWDAKCVEPGEKVFVTVFSKEPVEIVSATFSNSGDPSLTAGPPTTGTPPGLATAPSDSPTSTPIPPSTVDLPPTPFPDVPPVPTSTQEPGPVPLPTTAVTPTASAGPPVTNTPVATAVSPTPTTTPTLGRGDVNCNDDVDSIDAALLLQLIAGLLSSLDCEDDADVNQNGVVDSIDVAIVLQFVAGLISSLPV